MGDTYLIQTADSRYVFRVYRNTHRSLTDIKAEVELLLALRESVSVSYPIADKTGEYVQAFSAAEGTRYGVMFSYAKGESVATLSDSQLRQLGTEMAKFHQVSSSIALPDSRWEFNIKTTLVDPLNRVKPWLALLPDELTWWIHATARASEELNELPTHTFTVGYCHYDVLPKNFHFDGDRITLFDFDFFGRGWLINDLMTFWTQLCIDRHMGRLSQSDVDRCFNRVLDAYQLLRPVSSAELQAIPALSLAWWCYYMGFHATHDQFTVLVQPPQLKMRTALIRNLSENSRRPLRLT